uniref:Uncharacterized protein n=1 Tax=Octopus bimaculoides TaxID=37653 RepID=A0A0L8G2B6_OCTBM
MGFHTDFIDNFTHKALIGLGLRVSLPNSHACINNIINSVTQCFIFHLTRICGSKSDWLLQNIEKQFSAKDFTIGHALSFSTLSIGTNFLLASAQEYPRDVSIMLMQLILKEINI